MDEEIMDGLLQLNLKMANMILRISRLESIVLGYSPLDINYQEPNQDEVFESNILERIAQLENQITNTNLNYFNPAASRIEQRAQELLQYIEIHGKITTTQAVRLLKVRHRAAARRAMEFVSNSIVDTEMHKSRSGMWILTMNCSNEKGNMHVPLKFKNFTIE
ncbi:MAG: hypothetical protein M8353_03300 [ANME-2 cluster archaeon]|nr:hypothetical protein [ANME-2 cluster archaeon]